ncbi:mitochondrial inner membrane protein required for protein import [Coemansia sp. RSA 1813]|nr:mitochondrial inner membrane protein required for protein import [Coemansia sp. RSA 1646]KAJ1769786.1 mitochondrial inner membrane protein required for protein import [Coemansia sp. RSA 1843]KAJ2085573.1 mitochondrial inner membrane protein required for protein import [Coemansia sp. RSA 986]KAJ2211054.1 mitochondrial inner membrane protein required for protein import [Coemansia sp. RSA 487]KAJ2562940.1 mitochondrial inner membrane protein required for protein import [Coemansia sp. RSA 1813]
MTRTKKHLDKAHETPEKLQSNDELSEESKVNEKTSEAYKDPLQSHSASEKKKPDVSPFGFSSVGSGMAKSFLGEEPAGSGGENGAGSSRSQDDHQNVSHRSSESAAEARRARRQRADLPPLQDDPMIKAFKIVGTGILFGALIGGIGYNAYPYTEEEMEQGFKDDPEKNALQQIWQRVVRRWESTFVFFSEPATEKLLPDPNEYTMPYTLVLNLDDMLIHMDWSKESGWRIAKRPGLDHFLAYMASMYEVVVFSTQPSHSGMLVMERLDPLEYAPYRLYKDHMRNIDGKNYKDLTTINRDMSRVIMIDVTPDSIKMQPDNVLMARPFHGDAKDNWIEQITEFLEYVHMMEPKDVRSWIKTYAGMDAAREFNKWEDSVRRKLVDEWEEKRKNAGSWKSWVFGGVPSDLENPPVPDFDKMRKMMRENFEVQHKEVLALIEKDRKHNEEEMQRQMKDMTLWKMMTQAIGGQNQNPEGSSGGEASAAGSNPQTSSK